MDDDESKEEIERKKAAEDCLPHAPERVPKTQTENAGGKGPPKNTRIGASTPNERPRYRHSCPQPHSQIPNRRNFNEDLKEEKPAQVVIDQALTVKEFAQKLRISDVEIIKRLFVKGHMRTVNQVVELEVAREFATDWGYELIDFERPEGA